MSGRRRDLIIGAVTVALFALVLAVVIPNQIRVPGNIAIAALSPAFWPTTVAWMGLVLGGVIGARGLLGRSTDEPDEPAPPEGGQLESWRSLGAIGLMFVYFGLLRLLGVVVPSVIVIPALAYLFGERRPGILLPVAVILPIALYYFFTRVANIPLPLGAFEQLLY